MGMHGYYDVFPDKWGSEIRTAVIEFDESHRPVVARSLPDGTYLFTEYYCTDLDCHCERVLVKVLLAESEGARLEEVATIGYSWNPKSDAAWAEVNSGIPNPFLDPLNRQADYAPDLLEFWTAMIERDKHTWRDCDVTMPKFERKSGSQQTDRVNATRRTRKLAGV